MPYLPDIHTYLHNSSLLIQAYPNTRITTKYSLPRKPNSHSKLSSPSKRSQKSQHPTTITNTNNTETAAATDAPQGEREKEKERERERREPSATLTLKTFHPESGICLKYKTDKAQEVGRLMAGLGRLAMGEVVEMPSAAAGVGGDAMEVDAAAPGVEEKAVPLAPVAQHAQQAGGSGGGGGGVGGGKKKKKGKK